MQGCDMDEFYKDTVTIYNHFESQGSYEEFWYPTVLTGVRLLIQKGARVAATGRNDADTAILHILTDDLEKMYLLPKQWQGVKDKAAFFTIATGDFFVEGNTSAEALEQENFAQYMKEKYDNCFQVTTVDSYSLIPHIEVGGK